MKARVAICLASLLVAAVAVAQGGFPGNDGDDPRLAPPNDPLFDCDEEQPPTCGGANPLDSSVYAEHHSLFSFAPSATANRVFYAEGPRQGQSQISGSSVDLAWQKTLGDGRVVIAITDTGVRWDNDQLRSKIWLNRGELPMPQGGPNVGDTRFGGYDVNGDGRFNVDDYANDSRVDKDAGINGIAGVVDGQDLLAAFSDNSDADGNGYIDDIVGWDFFEDDNDPDDTSSYSNARYHGQGRGIEAAELTNDGKGEAGVCPECMIMPLRIWDTFVVPGDNWAIATVFAADHGAQVEVTANGALGNTPSAKAANRYAYDRGMALMHVSSDLNTSNHNYPTNYIESIYINGCISDQHTLLGSEFGGGGQNVQSPDPITTWFRASNLTQYGAHAHVCWEAITGSEATGHAGGAAGMIVSYGLQKADADPAFGGPLSANEVKQLLTKTAEDVLAGNTVGSGIPDHAQPGFDEHFGYGRVDLYAALQAIDDGKVPPEALIEDPPWWHLLNPQTLNSVPIRGTARAPRSASCTYTLEWAVGIEPLDGDFTQFGGGACASLSTVTLGQLPLDTIADAIGPHTRTGSVPAANPGERADINAHMFTVRLRVTDANDVEGEDRKVYLALNDDTAHPGWPKFVDVGGNNTPVIYDLDGDGLLEIIEADAGGRICVYNHDGSRYAGFNGGACWQLGPAFFHQPAAPGFDTGAVPAVTGGLRTPAIGDIDNDFEPEIVVTSIDGRIFALNADGSLHFQRAVNTAFSTRAVRAQTYAQNDPDDPSFNPNHPKRGFVAPATLADLNRDGQLEVLAPALDGYIYGWAGNSGNPLPGFPKKVAESVAPSGLEARGELIYPVAIANLDDDSALEIVTGSADVIAGDFNGGCTEPDPRCTPEVPAGSSAPPGSGTVAAQALANSAGAQSRIYAFDVDLGSGTVDHVPNWPVAITGILPGILPFVGPQNGLAVGNLDGPADVFDEVVASITSSDVVVFQPDGTATVLTSQGTVNGGATSESSKILNLFEGAVIGDINGNGVLDVARQGLTLSGAINLLAVGQNQPQNHVIQVWDGIAAENYAPGFPTAHDDFGLLSSPAIADVSAAPQDSGNEVIAGSGLYLVQAYNGRTGLPAAGFPKQTGGWLIGVPTIGDIDDDGLLELVGSTREGWRFVWDLDAPATQAAINQWWTEAHDEHHTQRYGHDSRPPRKVRNLAWDGTELSFIAAGDDWGVGAAQSYRLRTLDRPIVTAADWNAASPLSVVDGSSIDAGDPVVIALDPAASAGYVAVVAEDDAQNKAAPVSVAVGSVGTPVPVVQGGTVVVGIQPNVSAASGETVDAGSFILNSSFAGQQTISAFRFQLSAQVVRELRLFIDGAAAGSVIVPASGTATLPLNNALTLNNGEQADIRVQAVLAGDTSTAALLPVSTAWASPPAGDDSAAYLPTLLFVAMLGFLVMASRRNRLLLVPLMFMLWLTACGGGRPDGVTPINPGTTTLRLTGITGSGGGDPLAYNGVPAVLATLTRQ